MNQQAVKGRPVAVEQLESRFCLSSPVGGDFAYQLGQVAIGNGDAQPAFHRGQRTQAQSRAQAARVDAPFAAPFTAAAMQKLQRLADNLNFVAQQPRQTVIAMPGLILVINWPKYAMPKFDAPTFDAPQANDGHVDVAPPSASPGQATAANEGIQPAAAAQQSNVELVQSPADATDAGDVLAATNVTVVEEAVGAGPTLATATAPAAASLATASTVIDRLTSSWYDGSTAGDVAGAVFTQWLPNETLVAAAVDAATNLFAPLAQTAASVASAVAPAAAVTYEIAHMGSPFALLADSLATFVEESATVTNVVAQANARGPWALTAGVTAADVVVLTYVYRRKTTRRRAQLAPVGVA
jgi:hypothetical protein